MSQARKTREYINAVKAAETFDKPNAFGAGRWAGDSHLRRAGMFKKKGLHFGFSPDGKRKLRYQKSGHVLVVAAARTGKLLSVVAGLILSLSDTYSLLLVDPKGEMTCVVAKQRRRLGKVYVWNPYGIHRDYIADTVWKARINPFDDIDAKRNCEADMRALFKTFWTSTDDHNEPHWLPNGFNLAVGIAVALKQQGQAHEQNLPFVRSILTGPLYEFCRMAVMDGSPFVRQALQRFAEPGADKNKELDGFRSVAITQTDWLSDPEMSASLRKSDFSMRDAKRKAGITISEVLPITRLGDGKASAFFAGWFLHCSLDEGEKGSRVRCVAVIDEMSSLGFNRSWLDAFGLGAGAAGIQIVAIYQDVSQIMNQFGKAWSTVVQNCGVTCWFGARDEETRKVVSALAGTTEIVTHSRNVAWGLEDEEHPRVSDSKSQAHRPLIYPAEVGQLADDEMIVFAEGVRHPIVAKRKPYPKVFLTYGKNPFYAPGTLWERLFG